MSMVISGDNGLTFPAGSTQVQAGNYQTMVNRIINGRMEIDQRNAGASVNSNGAFPVDRFAQNQVGGGVVSWQRSTVAPAGFINSCIGTVTTADSSVAASDYYRFYQNIEGLNVADLGWGTANAQPITISFWVRSSVTGTYCVAIQNGGLNNRSYATTYTISAANTWEYKTVTIAGDTTGTWNTNTSSGFLVLWDLGSGSDWNQTSNTWVATNTWKTSGQANWIGTNGATFYITGVDLRVGSYTVVPQDFRSYGTELALCQRYYASGLRAIGYGAGTTSVQLDVRVPVTMRVAPTITFTSALTVTDSTANYTQSSANSGTTLASENGGIVNGAGNFTGLTLHRPYIVNTVNFNNPITASAEL